MFYYTITIISSLLGFLGGMLFENRRLKIKSKKVLEKHLKELDELEDKIDRHYESVAQNDNDQTILIIEHALEQALLEERYEEASQYRYILKELKKQK